MYLQYFQQKNVNVFAIFQDRNFYILGPVVQSIVSVTSMLVVKMLTFLISTVSDLQVILFAEKMRVAFANAKALTFFHQRY